MTSNLNFWIASADAKSSVCSPAKEDIDHLYLTAYHFNSILLIYWKTEQKA